MSVEIPTSPIRTIPVTPEATAGFPDQPLLEGATSVAEQSAYVAVMSRKGNQMPNIVEQVKQPAHEGRIVRAEDAPMVAMIERIVMDPSIPIDRLHQMIAMKERMEDRAREDEKWQARKAYMAAFAACEEQLPVIRKNQRNKHTNSNYADLAAIEDQAMPIIHSHGFFVSFQPAGYNDQGELLIKWKIGHKAGHEESDTAGIPVDGAGSQGKVNKTGTQAFGSTATYGRRYLLCMLFNISTGDDRDGNRPPEDEAIISDEQAAQIRKAIEETDSDIVKLCNYYKIEAIVDLPASRFNEAMALIGRARKAS